jgi:alpha-L-rhamnosidase
MLVSYWGEMLKLGATSVWEQFDPTVSGAEHYAMYGSAFGKSLCHAWGAGPVYILGRYIAGVEVTGADSFRVAPQPGIYKSFKARVPIGSRGEITVKYDGESFTLKTDVSGGVFEYGGAYTMLEANKEIKISI